MYFRLSARSVFVCTAWAVLLTGCQTSADDHASPTTSGTPAVVEGQADPIGASLAQFPEGARSGAVVYVPVYSHIYHNDGDRRFKLAVTLSLRNTDPRRSVTVASVAYYDSDGRLVREYLDAPLTLGPLVSRAYVVAASDDTGGSGANFLVTWSAETSVAEPLIETVMISTASSQGLSFTGQARVVQRLGEGE